MKNIKELFRSIDEIADALEREKRKSEYKNKILEKVNGCEFKKCVDVICYCLNPNRSKKDGIYYRYCLSIRCPLFQ